MTRIRNIREEDLSGGMPFDRWDGDKFVHATGREYWDEFPGCWRTEYEDDVTCGQPASED